MKRTAKGWQGCSEVACKLMMVVVVIMLMLDLMKRTVQKAARQFNWFRFSSIYIKIFIWIMWDF